MDKIFEKIGIYDFMGIWSAGIIVTLYSIITIVLQKRIDVLKAFQSIQTDISLIVIATFCIVSYIVGVYLHEIGKRICENILTMFEIENIEDIETPKYKNNRVWLLFHPIISRKMYLINQTRHIENKKALDIEIAYLKNKDLNKMIDKYHSIYGLTRGILTGFLLHLGFYTIWVIIMYANSKLSSDILSISIIVFDLISIRLFFIRTYRYYISWIKNIAIQYDLCIKNEKEKNVLYDTVN